MDRSENRKKLHGRGDSTTHTESVLFSCRILVTDNGLCFTSEMFADFLQEEWNKTRDCGSLLSMSEWASEEGFQSVKQGLSLKPHGVSTVDYSSRH